MTLTCQKLWQLIGSRQSYCNNNKSRAVAGRTARCRCKCWLIRRPIEFYNFSAVSPPQHGLLVYISDHSNAENEITHITLIFTAVMWRNITAIAKNNVTWPKHGRPKATVTVNTWLSYSANKCYGSAPFRPIPFRSNLFRPNLFRPIPSPNPNP